MKKSKNEEILANSYDRVDKLLDLASIPAINGKVQTIIVAANAVMDSICQKADAISITAFDELTEAYPDLGMPKKVWLELVHIRRLQRHSSMPEDMIQKLTENLDGANNVTALRQAVVNSIDSLGKDIEVPSIMADKSLTFTSDLQLQENFTELLNTSADDRNELDTILWPKLHMFGEAFEHLTGDDYKAFKALLDMYHYRKGGWPNPKTPPRVWGIIHRFTSILDLLDKYDYDLASGWCKRFGLEIKRTTPSPTLHMFTENAAAFGKYFMFKINEEHTEKYLELGIRPWHHLLISGDICIGYVWDSRLIEVICDASEINVAHVNTDYIDSCNKLQIGGNVTNTTNFNVSLVNDHIPELLMPVEKENEL